MQKKQCQMKWMKQKNLTPYKTLMSIKISIAVEQPVVNMREKIKSEIMELTKIHSCTSKQIVEHTVPITQNREAQKTR